MTDDDFGGRDIKPENPFPQLRANAKLSALWASEVEAHNAKHSTKHRFPSPLDALKDLERQRKLPPMPWPAKWTELGRRCRIYAGQCVGIVGPTGGGKTSFAIEIACAAAGEGIPVLWAPLELDAPEVDLRIVANRVSTHMGRVRDEWSIDMIAQQLAAVSDVWRFVDRRRDPDEQISACRAIIQIAKRIYGRPPMLVVDYLGKLSSISRDPRLATREHAERFREMILEEECYCLLLAQPSRQNNSTLTGKNDVEQASDAIAVAAESSELEHACSVLIALNVFKADDSPVLDCHALITKARNTGQEGREGMRFSKPGGVWTELGHLPATPNEIRAEVARAAKDKNRITPATAESVKADITSTKIDTATDALRKRIVEALRRHGMIGMTSRELRSVPGAGAGERKTRMLQELERSGTIERFGEKWRLAAGRFE